MTLGSEVRRRRLALGLTLDQLSERSGLSPHYLSTLENDHRDPHVSTLLTVAKALRVRPGDLLEGTSSTSARSAVSALFERAPAEAQDAVMALLRVIATSRQRPSAKGAKRS